MRSPAAAARSSAPGCGNSARPRWTAHGGVAGRLVVMARVPPGDGRRGGITAFVVEAAAAGITVERRNAFMGLRGLENGVTRFHEVRVPAASRIGAEGQGLKIAL